MGDVRDDISNLEISIGELAEEYQSSTEESNELFDLLTNKSTTLELVKARCGITKGSLATMLEQVDQQNETTLVDQDYDLLRGIERRNIYIR